MNDIRSRSSLFADQTSSTPSTRWQPSALDVSSPTYSGAMTGQRPPVPGGRAVARPTRRRPLALVISALVGGAVASLILVRTLGPAMTTLPPAPIAPPVAVLEVVHGPVTILPADGLTSGEAFSTLAAGTPIAVGTVIETAGAPGGATGPIALASVSSGERGASGGPAGGGGRAAFRLADGSSVRLDVDTRVRLASETDLILERGAVYVDSAAGSGVEVRTAMGVVRDVGTQFEVRVSPAAGADGEPATLRIRVREGRIILREDGGAVHDAGAGVELAMRPDGSVERGTTPIHGPRWAWVYAVAPIPDVEGKPLRFFLDWVVREGGWTLRFADPETTELAAATVLHGDVSGLDPTEAMTMIFDGSGLVYTLEDGVFRVARKPDATR